MPPGLTSNVHEYCKQCPRVLQAMSTSIACNSHVYCLYGSRILLAIIIVVKGGRYKDILYFNNDAWCQGGKIEWLHSINQNSVYAFLEKHNSFMKPLQRSFFTKIICYGSIYIEAICFHFIYDIFIRMAINVATSFLLRQCPT